MKQLLFYLMFPAFGFAQTLDVAYSLDTVGGRDSFFLVETISRRIPESTRPQSTTTSILFRDTAELVAYIARMTADKASMETRITQMQAQLTLLDARITAIEGLRDSVLPLLGAVSRIAPTPIDSRPTKPDIQKTEPAKATLPKKSKKKG